ncbi:hypothetical protein [[Mycoplasma] testudinis]|uniref:hypothetical protein n=1 Tax=[Mycoplasma] testudinis TaxID=33924 RepID=UPI0004877258|nr:hypothetical protein [[Mycoplasma] testudinis]
MKILITGKKIELSTDQLLKSARDYGHAFSEDRVYTIVNDYLELNLRKYSRFLFFMVAFLFRSSNYKHSTDIVNGKPFWVWFVDIFCWLCLFAFIGCLISGIAQPIAAAITQAIRFNLNSVTEELNKSFGNPTAIVLLVFAFVTFGIAMFYLYLIRKVVAVNKKYSLKDYVIYKTSFILNWEKFINAQKNVKKNTLEKIEKLIIKGKIKKVPPFCLVENMEIFSDDARWTILQICNVLNKLFPEFALTLLFNNIPEDRAKRLISVTQIDFKYLKIHDLSEPTISVK